MREAKFTRPVTIYVSKETYQKVKAITDERKISMAEWFRMVAEKELTEGYPIGGLNNDEKRNRTLVSR